MPNSNKVGTDVQSRPTKHPRNPLRSAQNPLPQFLGPSTTSEISAKPMLWALPVNVERSIWAGAQGAGAQLEVANGGQEEADGTSRHPRLFLTCSSLAMLPSFF